MAPPIAWPFEPIILVLVVLAGAIYVAGWRRARRPRMPHPPGFGRLALFIGGLLTIYAATASPIDPWADDLLVLHMTQHLLLLDIAPILLILGLTKGIMRPVTRRIRIIEERAGLLAHPAFAVLVYCSSMWIWHIPAMYDLALNHPVIHEWGEHTSFLIGGSMYWWYLLSPIRSRMHKPGMAPIAYMVATKFIVGVLGVGLAFDPHALYSYYVHQPRYWGLTAVQDQNMAGLVMALEQSLVMGAALVVLFVGIINDGERRAQRVERLESRAEEQRQALAS